MEKLPSFLKKPGSVFCVIAVVLIFICFFNFRMQVDAYIQEDMRYQIEAIQENSTLLIQNEMNYLKRLTASAALMLSQTEIQTDEDILQALEDYASTSNIVRTLFITLDGHAYTNYAGYLGQSSKDTSIDDISLSEITQPIFSQPYYAEDVDEIIFGVIAPVTMGRRQGVLVSSYNVKEFSKLLENKFIDGTTEIGIISNKGAVVSGKSNEQFQLNIFNSLRKVQFASSSVERMQADFAEGKSGFAIYRVDDIARYCSYAPVGLNDWYVVVTVKENFLRSKLANIEQYGVQLTIELVLIMLILFCVIITVRMKEQKKIRHILEQAAMMDGLTGIYNRRAIEEIIEQRLRDDGTDTHAALLVIDLDDFKQINDQQGHLVGDHVLRACANKLKNIFAEEGVVGRIGGDEFIVFLWDGSNIEQIEDKINGLIRDFYIENDIGKRQKISISVGIAQAGPEANTFLILYQLADKALYRAKQTGKAKLSN